MRVEELNETIEVTVEHRYGRMTPVSFVWRQRNYTVKFVHRYWKEMQEHHYSVSTGSADVFELVFNPDELAWRLSRVLLEG